MTAHTHPQSGAHDSAAATDPAAAHDPAAATDPAAAHDSAAATDPAAAHDPAAAAVDVAVIGGGSAGLAAAVALARSRRSVAVIDAGAPRNAPAVGAHNVLGQEGSAPGELLARGRTEATGYGATLLSAEVTRVTGVIDRFAVHYRGQAATGGPATGVIRARRIILATGLVDELPDLPGVREGWGHSVLHCPFCHGWEVRDRRIAVLLGDPITVHQTLLFAQLSNRVTAYVLGAAEPTADESAQFAALGVDIVRGPVARLVLDGRDVTGVALADGSVHAADAAVVAPRFIARTEVFTALGGEPEATPFGVTIPADPRGATPVPGVWAAGNASNPMAMVTAAAASGTLAGAGVHGELALADLAAAVESGAGAGVRARHGEPDSAGAGVHDEP